MICLMLGSLGFCVYPLYHGCFPDISESYNTTAISSGALWSIDSLNMLLRDYNVFVPMSVFISFTHFKMQTSLFKNFDLEP